MSSASPIPQQAGAPWRQALALIKELPIAALSQLALLLGGLVLLVFFVRLGFMPEISLESVLSLFYAVAMLGVLLVALMVSAMVLPAILLRYAMPWPEGGVTGWKLLTSTVLAAAVWWAYYVAWMNYPDWHARLGTTILVLVGGAMAFWAILFLKEQFVRSRPWLFYVMAGAQQFAVLTPPLVIIAGLLAGGDLGHVPVWLGLGYLALLLLGLAFIAAVQALVMDRNRGLVLAFGVTYLVWAFLVTGSAGNAFDGLMASLQWGDVQPVRAVLTRTGCDQLNLAAGRTVCDVPAAADTLAAVCPLNIRSRIGAQVLLASVAPPASAASSASSPAGWQVALDRKELLAWSIVSANCSPVSPARSASAAP